ncbi:MAG TPA: hypothetical protein VEA37_06015 [Flavobacterium sp.]|nr:hypothetical protein [Flavobacterium sp.]
MNWETIEGGLERAKVFGGWLVRLNCDVMHAFPDGRFDGGWDWRPALTFVPDPNHEWKIGE